MKSTYYAKTSSNDANLTEQFRNYLSGLVGILFTAGRPLAGMEDIQVAISFTQGYGKEDTMSVTLKKPPVDDFEVSKPFHATLKDILLTDEVTHRGIDPWTLITHYLSLSGWYIAIKINGPNRREVKLSMVHKELYKDAKDITCSPSEDFIPIKITPNGEWGVVAMQELRETIQSVTKAYYP